MIGMAVAFEDFVGRVKEKFGVKGRFKLKIRDEGDLITMGDRDDWDMALQTVSREARREGTEMGKMQVRIFAPFFLFVFLKKVLKQIARKTDCGLLRSDLDI